MKIRIKKTGEVLEDIKFIDTTLHKITIQYLDDGITFSLDEGNGIPYIVIHSKEERGTAQKVMRIVENLTMLFGGEE